MNSLVQFFLLIAGAGLFVLPRRSAPLPLLMGACYMTLGQAIEVGPFRFTFIRLLLGVGVLRVLIRREHPGGGWQSMDGIVLLWAAWALCTSAFRETPGETLVNRLGLVYNTLGSYYLFRCFCHNLDEVVNLLKLAAIVLVPVAIAMVYEQWSQHNVFAVFGGVPDTPALRQGRLRSQGPFAHAILAGTVGAVFFPLMVGLWLKHRLSAMLGMLSGLIMVLTSASSGPLASLLLSIFALVMWHWRRFTRQMLVAALVLYILLELMMNAPAYYIIARVDLVGGSTGRHRAALIQSAIEHLDEWWLAGTDYTRHWMVTGVGWSEDHVDITNHYLAQGVRGGLLLMFLFILMLWRGFKSVSFALQTHQIATLADQFIIWSVGAALFAHTATCLSVAYFDQSFLFLYMNLVLAVSLGPTTQTTRHEINPHSNLCPQGVVTFAAARFR